MRKLVLVLVAITAVAFTGASLWTADARIGSGTLGLPVAAKNYSPIDRIACRARGPLCPLGYTRVCRPWRCWCTPCR